VTILVALASPRRIRQAGGIARKTVAQAAVAQVAIAPIAVFLGNVCHINVIREARLALVTRLADPALYARTAATILAKGQNQQTATATRTCKNPVQPVRDTMPRQIAGTAVPGSSIPRPGDVDYFIAGTVQGMHLLVTTIAINVRLQEKILAVNAPRQQIDPACLPMPLGKPLARKSRDLCWTPGRRRLCIGLDSRLEPAKGMHDGTGPEITAGFA
jgi:hypothetical protein